MSPLFSCPDCALPVKSHEAECPHCGESLRDASARIGRTGAVLLLGLVGLGGCASAPKYGVPATNGDAPESTASPEPTSSASAEPAPTSSAKP